ncbi:MAG: lipopolysaccharide assembly protein LapA domain-containing protein [Caldisericaceae bacterium]
MMKKISFFLITMLLLLVVSLIFVYQNSNATAQLKFFSWSIPEVSVGVLVLFSIIAGVLIMWLISVVVYIGNSSKFRRSLKEKDNLLRVAKEEKDSLVEELSRLKLELQGKTTEGQSSSSAGKPVSNEPKE